MNAARPGPVPDPAPGSARFFTLLYTPRERRAAVRTLLALSDEIGAGLGRQLDHGVAHMRLEWWRAEAQRFAAGQPAHPWLLAWQREHVPAPDLTPLIEAAAIDLASERLAAVAARKLPQALFVLAAAVLSANTPQAALIGQQEDRIAALGRAVDELEHPAASPPGVAPGPAASQVPTPLASTLPSPALQRTLAPLLVWAALAAHQARRRQRRERRERRERRDQREQRVADKSSTMTGSALAGIVDNVVAWRGARAARRGRFHLEDLRGMGQ